MTRKEKFASMDYDELAEFIHLNICNSCHFCGYYKSKACKINVNCIEGIKQYLKDEDYEI